MTITVTTTATSLMALLDTSAKRDVWNAARLANTPGKVTVTVENPDAANRIFWQTYETATVTSPRVATNGGVLSLTVSDPANLSLISENASVTARVNFS